MIDLFQEHCDYEFNARYDYVSEAYAATVLDPHHEGHSDYLMGCEQNGTEPLSFDAYMASLKVARRNWQRGRSEPVRFRTRTLTLGGAGNLGIRVWRVA